jgi:hypothetical protein
MAGTIWQQLQVPYALSGSHSLDLGQNERLAGDLARRPFGVGGYLNGIQGVLVAGDAAEKVSVVDHTMYDAPELLRTAEQVRGCTYFLAVPP